MTRVDRLLVAGDGARGEDHAVARARASPRDARPRRCAPAPRAARPGCRCRAPPPCRAADSRRCRATRKSLHAVEIAGLARDLRRPAPWRGRPRTTSRPQRARRLGDRADARDVGGEGGDRDPAGRAPDQLGQRLGDVGFRRRAALAHGVGGIADQRQAALVAERAQLRLVGRRADHRRRIDLPVAGVQHGAERRADDQRVRFRDRMRDRDVVRCRTARA